MRFLIYVGGLDDGMISPCGGEARYMCNIAQALAHYGHEVDCVGGSGGGPFAPPRWGAQTPIPNINMVNEHAVNMDKERHYDAYINTPFEYFDESRNVKRCYDIGLNVDIYIHIMWSWNPGIEASIAKICPCWKEPHKHIISYPYDRPLEYVAVEAPIRVIPNPVYKEYIPHAPQTRRGIVWAGKGVFIDEWPEDKIWHSEGIKLLRAVASVSNKLDLQCYFVLTHKDFNTNRAQRFGVPEVLGSIKNKTVFEGYILKNELDRIFSLSRVSVRPPHYSGSFLDSFPQGAIPLFYSGNSGGALGDMFKMSEIKPFTLESTQEDMENVLEKIFTEDEYYEKLITSAQNDMLEYSWESSYSYILNIMKEFGVYKG